MKLWGLQFGPYLTHIDLEKIPDYALFRNNAPFNLSGDIKWQRRFPIWDGVRNVGTFGIEWDRLIELCRGTTKTRGLFGLISPQTEPFSDDQLWDLFRCGGGENVLESPIELDEVGVALAACLGGNVLLRTFGGFDDRYRSIHLLSRTIMG